MKDSKTLALIGAALLFIGAFTPILSMPIVGSFTYFDSVRGDGVIMVVLAAATAALAATGRTRDVLWTGLLSLALLLYSFLGVQSGLAASRARVETGIEDSPLRDMAEAALGSVQLQWGWALLLLAAGVVTHAGWQARQKERSSPSS